MHKIFLSVQRSPTFENKRCETFTKRYANGMKSFSSLDYRPACVWRSFANVDIRSPFIACYNGLADQLCASGVGTTWRMRRGCVACTWLQQASMKSVRDSAILMRLLGCCWRTGSTRRFIKIAMRRRSCSKNDRSFSPGDLLLPSAATSASHLHPPIFMTQINDDVCQRFYTAYGMTSW